MNQSIMTRRHGSISCCTALLALSVLGHAAAATPPVKKTPARTLNSIRCSDAPLVDLLDQGLARSATLRDLESRLEGSSVIIYLSRALLPSGLAGRTRLIGAGDRWRFLSMEVDERIGPLDLLTAIGHELEHAVEIAGAPDVLDLASLEALYRRIGRVSGAEHSKSHWYETRDAEESGRRVRAELTGWAWAPLARPTRHS
jgi:hypothetical protein